MMVREGSLVEACSKCCVLEITARGFPIMVEEVEESGDDLSSGNGFLIKVVWEDFEEEQEEVWSRCSQCTLPSSDA